MKRICGAVVVAGLIGLSGPATSTPDRQDVATDGPLCPAYAVALKVQEMTGTEISGLSREAFQCDESSY